jgi:hypothetical protein
MGYPVFALGDKWEPTDANAVGLWLVKTQTVGTGVASTVVSGAFSSDYENYLITYTGGNMSVSTALKLQMGSTTNGYYGAFVYGTNTGTTVASANDNNTSSFTYAGGNSDTVSTHMSVEVLAPNLAHQTLLIAKTVHYSTNFGTYTGVLANTTAYTGFTLIPFSGTMTGGTIRVYGYRN